MQMSMRKDPSSVRIRDVLLEMRRYRMGLIQTADQLRFSYLAVIEGAKYIKGDTSLQVSSSSPICSLLLTFKVHSALTQIKTPHKHNLLYVLEEITCMLQILKGNFVFLSRSRGKSSQTRRTIHRSSPLRLLFLLPETLQTAELSHRFSQKVMRSSHRWPSAVLGNHFNHIYRGHFQSSRLASHLKVSG